MASCRLCNSILSIIAMHSYAGGWRCSPTSLVTSISNRVAGDAAEADSGGDEEGEGHRN